MSYCDNNIFEFLKFLYLLEVDFKCKKIKFFKIFHFYDNIITKLC